MYDSYFGLTELPFSIAPDPRYLYLSDGHREALAHLLYGIGEGGGFLVLTGEVGTGKTTVCRALLEQLPPEVDVAMVFNPASPPSSCWPRCARSCTSSIRRNAPASRCSATRSTVTCSTRTRAAGGR